MCSYILEYVKKTSIEEFARRIDHTVLKPSTTLQEVFKALEDLERYGFATLVVPPWTLPFLSRESSHARICTVVGFPHGNTSKNVKVEETKYAIEHGVKEIDMVINVQALKSKMWDYIEDEIGQVVRIAHENDVLVKVIIECGLLSDEEIVKTSQIVVKAGGDYVKTSTGYGPRGASIHDIVLIKTAIGGRGKVKASGGIRRVEDAISMILAGADRIGTSSGVEIVEEFRKLKRVSREI